jgi:type II secretory pathway component PulF
MEKYLWKGVDSSGQNQKGVIAAKSREQLSTLLLEQGIALLDCKVERESLIKQISFSRSVSLEQKAFFFNQLAILIESGVGLLKALNVVCRQIESKRFKNVVLSVIDDVAAGSSLSAGLEKFSDIFSPSIIQVIKSGEHSGKLDFVLKSLGNYLSDRLLLKSKLQKAALMPAITVTFAFLIMWGIFVFVVPQFETLFNSLGKQVPGSTKFVIGISDFLRSSKFLIFMVIFLFLTWAARLIIKQDVVRRLMDKFLLNIYVLNKIFLLKDLIAFLQTLSLFLKTGVPLSNSLELSGQIIQNTCFKKKAEILYEYVLQGKTLEESMAIIGPHFFPENLLAVVCVGEQAGNLDVMLQKAASFFQEELGSKLQFMLTIFQPALMIVIGLLIAFLMLAIYMPIFNMASLV